MSIRLDSLHLPYPVELDAAVKNLHSEASESVLPDDEMEIYGDQSLFKSWREEAVHKVVARFRELEIGSSTDFFTDLLKELGDERHHIAAKMNSRNADRFGVIRTTFLRDEHTTLTHLTASRYREFNQKLRQQFTQFFPIFQQNIGSFSGETELSRYKVEKIDCRKLTQIVREVTQARPSTEEEMLKVNESIALLNTIGGISELVYLLDLPGLKPPKVFDPALGGLRVGALQFLVGTIEVKMQGRWRTLTRHVAWLNQKNLGPLEAGTVEYFKRVGFVTLMHTPRESLSFHIDELKAATKKLISARYETPELFKRDLAAWEFKFSHVMPYYRGSRSVLEVLREGICRFRGFESSATPEAEILSYPFFESYLNLAR